MQDFVRVCDDSKRRNKPALDHENRLNSGERVPPNWNKAE